MAISASATYEILPLEDVTLAAEVAGNSTANRATVRLWSRNDSNAQKWQFVASGTQNVWYIKDAETGKAVDVPSGMDANGEDVAMYTYNGADNGQKWTAEYVSTQTINGTAYETYQFVTALSSSPERVMDVKGNGAYIKSNVQIWQKVAGHPSQTFALVPTEWNAIGGTGNEQPVLPMATGGTFGTAAGTPMDGTVAISNGTVYPAWTCDWDKYQVRYRTRTRTAGESALSDWSYWKSISNGATTFDGWGTVGASNCTPTDYDGVKWSASGVAVDNRSSYDCTEVEFSVRAWTANWGEGSTASAHGGEYSWAVSTVRPIALQIPTATMAPDGLRIGWNTDWARGGNAVSADSNIFGNVHTVGDPDGYMTVPITSLAHVPDDGEVIELTFTFTTSEGLTDEYSGPVEVSYSSGHGSTLTLTQAVIGTYTTVTASDANASAWLVVPRGHGNRFVQLDGASPWTFPPPLGVPYTVFASVETQGGWESVATTFPAIDDRNYHITSQSLEYDLPIIGNVNGAQDFALKYSRDVESSETYNRERPVNILGRVTSADWTLKGAALPDTYDLCDWALHAGHAYFRAPNGFWAQVSVSGGSIDHTNKNYAKVEFSCIEEVW